MLFCSLEKIMTNDWLWALRSSARKNEALSIDNNGMELKHFMPSLIAQIKFEIYFLQKKVQTINFTNNKLIILSLTVHWG